MNETVNTSTIITENLTGLCNYCWIKIPIGIAIGIFAGVQTLVHVLLALVALDILSGVSLAFKEKKVSSYGFSRAIWKVVAYMFAIFAVRLIEMGALGGVYTFTQLMIGILSVTEGISILENTILMGLPLPKSFLDLISKQQRYQKKSRRNLRCPPK